LGANFEYDPKIISLSAFKQLGLMVISISIDLPSLTFFHFLTLVLFKASFLFVLEMTLKIFVLWVAYLLICLYISSCLVVSNL
jgi:hypothetical protein